MSRFSQYREGWSLFNGGEYFACHDVFEELWSDVVGPPKAFLQGLIQAAVALFQLERSNHGAARRLCLSACRYLEPYQPAYAELDVTDLMGQMFATFSPLLREETTIPGPLDLTDPPRLRTPEGNETLSQRGLDLPFADASPGQPASPGDADSGVVS